MSDKTALYCRVACADDDTMTRQEHSLRQYAEKSGYIDCECYRDNGISGLSLDRPAMQNLISDIKDKKVTTVIVLDLARVARGFAPMEKWFKILKKHGILFVSVKDNYRFPDDDCLFGNVIAQ